MNVSYRYSRSLVGMLTFSSLGCMASFAQTDHKMDKSELPVVVISEKDRNKIIEEGYNPLPRDFDRKKFAKEWDAVFDSVKTEVSKNWKFGICENDFFMSSDWGSDRFIVVEVMNKQMVNKSLIRSVHKLIAQLDVDYAVDVCNAWGAMKTSDGELHPDFNIIITRQRIMVYSQSNDILERFGLLKE